MLSPRSAATPEARARFEREARTISQLNHPHNCTLHDVGHQDGTTNKGIKDWPEILAGDEVLATAILDRLLHNSHVLNVKGCSYRLRDLERAVAHRD